MSDIQPKTLDGLVELTYKELRRMAHRRMRDERPGHTLGTTALVHEAYLKIAGMEDVEWENKAQYFTIAAQAMRRVLIDHARAKLAKKRGQRAELLSLDETAIQMLETDPEMILILNDALEKLSEKDPRMTTVVEMRYFVGFSLDETAELLNVSKATVKRDWQTARLWLFNHLKGRGPEGGRG